MKCRGPGSETLLLQSECACVFHPTAPASLQGTPSLLRATDPPLLFPAPSKVPSGCMGKDSHGPMGVVSKVKSSRTHALMLINYCRVRNSFLCGTAVAVHPPCAQSSQHPLLLSQLATEQRAPSTQPHPPLHLAHTVNPLALNSSPPHTGAHGWARNISLGGLTLRRQTKPWTQCLVSR